MLNTASNIFSVKSFNSKYNNTKLVVTVLDKRVSAHLAGINHWNTDKAGNYCTVIETLPEQQWFIATASAIYKSIIANIAQSNEANQALKEWVEISKQLAAMPRVLLMREDESAVEGTRRRKRFLYAACGYDDIKMREVLNVLKFTWSKDRYAYCIYDYPDNIARYEMILNEWNSKSKPVLVNMDAMYKIFPGLKSEQSESIRFIYDRWKAGWHGTLDADDMGIGKTLTALVAGRMAICAGLAKRIVVVANLQTVQGWDNEWQDKLSVRGQSFIYTSQSMSKARYKDPENIKSDIAGAELIVTNYEHIKNEDNLNMILPYCRNAIVVFDEATKCSNPDTDNFKAAVQASMASAFTIGLTGTPLSKNIHEAWSIFRLIDPGIYPKDEFNAVHLIENEKRIWIPKYKKAKTIILPEYRHPDVFNARVAEHFIRHEKNIAKMEAHKIERRYLIDPNDSRMETDAALKISGLVSEIYHKDVDWDAFGEEGVSIPRWQISALVHIQSALDDPVTLLDSVVYKNFMKDVKYEMDHKRIDERAARDYVYKNYQIMDMGHNKPLPKYGDEQRAIFEYLGSIDRSKWEDYIPAKTAYLARLLNYEWKDKRIVVFCTFSRTCDRVAANLKLLFPDRQISQIKGSMNTRARETSVEEFRASDNGMLICTDAMAFGANLQFADALVHYNIPWSSAVWKQRTDRIFRTGAIGRKDIVYLTLDHPLEKRKISLMAKNLKTIRQAMDIDMTDMPAETEVSLDFEAPRSIASLCDNSVCR